MDKGMIELISEILHTTRFIALGGGVAIIFFFIFGHHITGSRSINKQLEKLQDQLERVQRQLEKISEKFKNDDEKKAD